MKEVTSRTHKGINEVVALHQAKHRKQFQKFIAQGERTCETVLKALPKLLHQLYVTADHVEFAQGLTREKKITLVSPHVMEKLSTTKTASGIIGVFNIPEEKTPEKLTPGLVCANVAEPGNMGTLIRTSAALKLRQIIVVDGVDPWNPKVVQASAGSIAQVHIFRLSWQEMVSLKAETPLYALIASEGKKLTKSTTVVPGLLVVGNEAHGIPEKWLADCNESLTIAMPGKTDSLNVAVAGSLALYSVFGPE